MKVNITVDCTPDEARAFLGLPNIAPMQEAAMKQMQATMDKAAQTLGPEGVMKTLFPENLAEMKKSFWTQFTKGTAGS